MAEYDRTFLTAQLAELRHADCARDCGSAGAKARSRRHQHSLIVVSQNARRSSGHIRTRRLVHFIGLHRVAGRVGHARDAALQIAGEEHALATGVVQAVVRELQCVAVRVLHAHEATLHVDVELATVAQHELQQAGIEPAALGRERVGQRARRQAGWVLHDGQRRGTHTRVRHITYDEELRSLRAALHELEADVRLAAAGGSLRVRHERPEDVVLALGEAHFREVALLLVHALARQGEVLLLGVDGDAFTHRPVVLHRALRQRHSDKRQP